VAPRRVFNRLAEIAGEYLKKGSQVYVEGNLRTRKWQDKEGKERYTTEIVAERMQMLGSRSGMGDAGAKDRGDEDKAPVTAGEARRRRNRRASSTTWTTIFRLRFTRAARRGKIAIAILSQERSPCSKPSRISSVR